MMVVNVVPCWRRRQDPPSTMSSQTQDCSWSIADWASSGSASAASHSSGVAVGGDQGGRLEVPLDDDLVEVGGRGRPRGCARAGGCRVGCFWWCGCRVARQGPARRRRPACSGPRVWSRPARACSRWRGSDGCGCLWRRWRRASPGRRGHANRLTDPECANETGSEPIALAQHSHACTAVLGRRSGPGGGAQRWSTLRRPPVSSCWCCWLG